MGLRSSDRVVEWMRPKSGGADDTAVGVQGDCDRYDGGLLPGAGSDRPAAMERGTQRVPPVGRGDPRAAGAGRSGWARSARAGDPTSSRPAPVAEGKIAIVGRPGRCPEQGRGLHLPRIGFGGGSWVIERDSDVTLTNKHVRPQPVRACLRSVGRRADSVISAPLDGAGLFRSRCGLRVPCLPPRERWTSSSHADEKADRPSTGHGLLFGSGLARLQMG